MNKNVCTLRVRHALLFEEEYYISLYAQLPKNEVTLMNGKSYVSTCGSTSFFVDKKYPSIDVCTALKAEGSVCADFVFCDRISPGDVEEMMLAKQYVKQANISVLSDVTDNLCILKQSEYPILLENVFLPISEYYQMRYTDNVKFGYEYWMNFDAPSGLRPFVDGIKINSLMPYVETLIDDLSKYAPTNELEMIIMLDIWLQENIQYATGKESKYSGKIYCCPQLTRDSSNDDVLKNHFGRCEDIALSVSLILNHPRVNIKCRMVGTSRPDGFNHAWNIVECDGKQYVCDFTHNITRNPNKVCDALKAKSYNYQFTLLGLGEFYEKYGSSDEYDISKISYTSYRRDIIAECVANLISKGISTEWDDSVVLDSYVKGE